MGVLKIESKVEDVPRVITASGRGPEPGSRFDLVLKPSEGECALVVYLKPPRSKRGEPKPTAESLVWLRIKEDARDAPGGPSARTSSRDGLKAYREVLKGKGRLGPVTFKGRWSGKITWAGGQPVVELRRRVASYVTVTVQSRPGKGWEYTVQRNTSKWWVEGDGTKKGTHGRLYDAIKAAYVAVAGVTGPACAVKDTTRRQARDRAYAAERPISIPAAARHHGGKEWGAGSWRKVAEPVPPSDAVMGVNEGTVPVKLAPALRALDTDGQAGRFGVLTRDVGGVARGAFVWIGEDGTWLKSTKRATYMLSKPATKKRRARTSSKAALAEKPKRATAKKATAKKAASSAGCGGCTGGPHACSQCTKKPASKATSAKKTTKRAARPKATASKDAAIGDAIAAASQQALFAMLGKPEG